ncbi:MAG: FIST C-terminal domain-containing protein [Campylobacterota bacterium]|nr:FIST C-terminal domain-containing protein [Campylobacterota bacterium]
MIKNYLVNSLDEFIKRFKDSDQNLLLLVAEGCAFEHSKLLQVKPDVCGAIFPQIIYEDNNYDDAIVVIDVGKEAEVTLSSFEDFDKSKIDKDADDVVVFLDGLSRHITEFLENLYESTSIGTNIIGAGAGKLTLKQEKVLFTKETMIQDGVLLLTNSWFVETSAKHGWEEIAGPFVANDTKETRVYSLDYQDAYEVYKEIVEKDSNLLFNENNFFDIAKSYPLGIAKANSEILVRDPIARDNDSLLLVGDMDKNSVVYILKGDKNKLIESAKAATKEAISKKDNLKGIFVIDCISRVLFLEDDFKKELQIIRQNVNKKDFIMCGVLSLGEIANTNQDYIDFYNKTCVIGAF